MYVFNACCRFSTVVSADVDDGNDDTDISGVNSVSGVGGVGLALPLLLVVLRMWRLLNSVSTASPVVVFETCIRSITWR